MPNSDELVLHLDPWASLGLQLTGTQSVRVCGVKPGTQCFEKFATLSVVPETLSITSLNGTPLPAGFPATLFMDMLNRERQTCKAEGKLLTFGFSPTATITPRTSPLGGGGGDRDRDSDRDPTTASSMDPRPAFHPLGGAGEEGGEEEGDVAGNAADEEEPARGLLPRTQPKAKTPPQPYLAPPPPSNPPTSPHEASAGSWVHVAPQPSKAPAPRPRRLEKGEGVGGGSPSHHASASSFSTTTTAAAAAGGSKQHVRVKSPSASSSSLYHPTTTAATAAIDKPWRLGRPSVRRGWGDYHYTPESGDERGGGGGGGREGGGGGGGEDVPPHLWPPVEVKVPMAYQEYLRAKAQEEHNHLLLSAASEQAGMAQRLEEAVLGGAGEEGVGGGLEALHHHPSQQQHFSRASSSSGSSSSSSSSISSRVEVERLDDPYHHHPAPLDPSPTLHPSSSSSSLTGGSQGLIAEGTRLRLVIRMHRLEEQMAEVEASRKALRKSHSGGGVALPPLTHREQSILEELNALRGQLGLPPHRENVVDHMGSLEDKVRVEVEAREAARAAEEAKRREGMAARARAEALASRKPSEVSPVKVSAPPLQVGSEEEEGEELEGGSGAADEKWAAVSAATTELVNYEAQLRYLEARLNVQNERLNRREAALGDIAAKLLSKEGGGGGGGSDATTTGNTQGSATAGDGKEGEDGLAPSPAAAAAAAVASPPHTSHLQVSRDAMVSAVLRRLAEEEGGKEGGDGAGVVASSVPVPATGSPPNPSEAGRFSLGLSPLVGRYLQSLPSITSSTSSSSSSRAGVGSSTLTVHVTSPPRSLSALPAPTFPRSSRFPILDPHAVHSPLHSYPSPTASSPAGGGGGGVSRGEVEIGGGGVGTRFSLAPASPPLPPTASSSSSFSFSSSSSGNGSSERGHLFASSPGIPSMQHALSNGQLRVKYTIHPPQHSPTRSAGPTSSRFSPPPPPQQQQQFNDPQPFTSLYPLSHTTHIPPSFPVQAEMHVARRGVKSEKVAAPKGSHPTTSNTNSSSGANHHYHRNSSAMVVPPASPPLKLLPSSSSSSSSATYAPPSLRSPPPLPHFKKPSSPPATSPPQPTAIQPLSQLHSVESGEVGVAVVGRMSTSPPPPPPPSLLPSPRILALQSGARQLSKSSPSVAAAVAAVFSSKKVAQSSPLPNSTTLLPSTLTHTHIQGVGGVGGVGRSAPAPSLLSLSFKPIKPQRPNALRDEGIAHD